MNGNIKWVFCQPLIGGMALGFEEAFGCPPAAIITAGFKNDEHYIKYMNDQRNLNIPVIYMNTDYETFQTPEDEVLFKETCNDVDVFGHVAICSGLSAMNTCDSSCSTKKRGDPNNEQNQNMYNLTRLGMRIGANVVAFENAPAAYTKAGEATVNVLKEIGNEFNYSTQLIKTDTIKHGIPQSRLRTFLMFYKDSNPGIFEFENKDFKKLYEYLSDITDDAEYQDLFIGDIKTPIYDFVLDYTKKNNFLDAVNSIDGLKTKTVTAMIAIEAIGFDKAIDWIKDKIANGYDNAEYQKYLKYLEHAKNKRSIGKNFWDNTSYVPNRGSHSNAVVGKHIHMQIIGDRAINVREMMALMGLPDDFKLEEPKKNWNHICQNVPVKTSTYIGTQIKKFLNNELVISNESFIKQNNIKQTNDLV